VQRAVRAIKKDLPEVLVATDVCLCEYMSHGHCGIVRDEGGHAHILNDESLELLAAAALRTPGRRRYRSAERYDGRARKGHSRNPRRRRHQGTVIMSYAAKFCSAYYGPFREGGERPAFGDRRTYQMDCANAGEALREVELDIAEGADIVMINRPPLSGHRLAGQGAVWNADGRVQREREYSMAKAAAARLDRRTQRGHGDDDGIQKSGRDLIISYWARDVAACWGGAEDDFENSSTCRDQSASHARTASSICPMCWHPAWRYAERIVRRHRTDAWSRMLPVQILLPRAPLKSGLSVLVVRGT